jgi:hypothetical protein
MLEWNDTAKRYRRHDLTRDLSALACKRLVRKTKPPGCTQPIA